MWQAQIWLNNVIMAAKVDLQDVINCIRGVSGGKIQLQEINVKLKSSLAQQVISLHLWSQTVFFILEVDYSVS